MRVGRTRPGKGKYPFLLFIIFPFILSYLEYDFLSFSISVKEAQMKIVDVESPSDLQYSEKAVVHFAGPVTPHEGAIDNDFSLRVQDSLVLKRNTEYCQWREHEVTHCDRCGRDDHECNCRTTYYYTKGWSSHLINSLIFEQPAAHYNPQRDPFPSTSFAASNVQVNDFVLSPSLLANLKAPSYPVEWTTTGSRESRWYDSFWLPVHDYLGVKSSIYLPIDELQSTAQSHATRQHGFVYVGHGGYFYSPYEPSAQENLIKWTFQALEGTLLDWQIGDFIGGCRPGDIRVWYSIMKPEVVSVIGEAAGGGQASVGLISTQAGKRHIGFVHDGTVTAEEMFSSELSGQHFYVKVARFFAFIWCFYVVEWFVNGRCHWNWEAPRVLLAGVGLWGLALTVIRCISLGLLQSQWLSLRWFSYVSLLLLIASVDFPQIINRSSPQERKSQ
jgi:hypothetical protein